MHEGILFFDTSILPSSSALENCRTRKIRVVSKLKEIWKKIINDNILLN